MTSEAFWGRVEKVAGASGCWIWMGDSNALGYGLVTRLRKGKPRIRKRAHRVAWELTNGREIQEGMFVIHSCDVPACVRPSHLRLGTHQDNIDDMMRRGRHGQLCKTRCPKGHPYSGENLIVEPGARRCRICDSATHIKSGRASYYRNHEKRKRSARERMREYKALHRDEINARARAKRALKKGL